MRSVELEEEAEHCYEFKASTDGQGIGQGSCRVVALGDQREELWVEIRFDNLELEMGKEFEWTISVQEPDDDRFAEWNAECEPQAEG